MKNYIKILSIIIVTIFASCNPKEVEFITSFDFTVEDTHNVDTSIKIPQRTLFQITPEDIIPDAIYNFEYIIIEGEGFYQDQNGERLLENFTYEIKDLVFNFDFVAETEGDVRVLVKMENEQYDDEIEIVYEVTDRTFNFTSTTSVTSLNIGESVNINYAITEQGSIEEDNYTLKYSTDNNGSLSISGQRYEPGTVINLTDLNFTAVFTGETNGDHTIISEITALSNGDVVETENKITYLGTQFTLDIVSPNELTVGDTIEIDFVINETIGQSDFDVEYLVSGIDQEVKNNAGIIFENGTKYDVESNTFKLFLTGIENGQASIKWIVTNQFGEKQEFEITYTVNPIPFELSIGVGRTNLFTNRLEVFTIDIDGDDDVTYDVQISSSNNDVSYVYYNGINTDVRVFESDEINTLNNGLSNNLGFAVNERGQYFFDFTVTASNGAVKTESLTVNVLQSLSINSLVATYETNCVFCNSGFITNTSLELDLNVDPSLNIIEILIEGTDGDHTITDFTNLGNGVYEVSRSSNKFEDVSGVLFGPDSNIRVTITDSFGNSIRANGKLEEKQKRTDTKNGISTFTILN